MNPEIVGTTLRIRIRNPKMFTKFRTVDVGGAGKFSIIRGWSKNTGWLSQSLRFQLKDYDDYSQVYLEVHGIKGLTFRQRSDALNIAKKYFMKVKR